MGIYEDTTSGLDGFAEWILLVALLSYVFLLADLGDLACKEIVCAEANSQANRRNLILVSQLRSAMGQSET